MQTAVWRNGEWIEWDGEEEMAQPCAKADRGGEPARLLEELRDLARRHLRLTGRRLDVDADLARLFAATACGLPLGRGRAQGGVAIHVIGPSDAGGRIEIPLDATVDRVLLVRIGRNYAITGRLVAPGDLTGESGVLSLAWAELDTAEIVWPATY